MLFYVMITSIRVQVVAYIEERGPHSNESNWCLLLQTHRHSLSCCMVLNAAQGRPKQIWHWRPGTFAKCVLRASAPGHLGTKKRRVGMTSNHSAYYSYHFGKYNVDGECFESLHLLLDQLHLDFVNSQLMVRGRANVGT